MKQIKIVYSDDGRDKAIVGRKESEDDTFYTIVDKFGDKIHINKTRIVTIKEIDP